MVKVSFYFLEKIPYIARSKMLAGKVRLKRLSKSKRRKIKPVSSMRFVAMNLD